MSLLRRMGLALALAAMASLYPRAPSRADDLASSNSAAPVVDTAWYTGGTLHKTTPENGSEPARRISWPRLRTGCSTSKQQKAKVAAARET